MIAACPSCHARYRVEDRRIGAAGARLRCARCRGLFRVRAPGTAAAFPEADSRASDPARTRPVASSPARPDPEFQAGPDTAGGILLADADPVRAQETVAHLTGMGLYVLRVRDGVEALMNLQRMQTSVVILSADLPRISGWDLSEIIKRSDSLSATGVVVVGPGPAPGQAAHMNERAHEPDLHIDRVDPSGPVVPFLERYGLYKPPPSDDLVPEVADPEGGAPPEPSLARTVPGLTRSARTPATGLGEEREKAERLARIVVSDMVLYHPERFDLAPDEKGLLEDFGAEIQEGLALMSKRVDESVLSERAYLVEELLRVARERAEA